MSKGSEFNANKDADMAELSATFLFGMKDQEIIDLQVQIDSISLENFAANNYSKVFETEVEETSKQIQNLKETSIKNQIHIQQAEEETQSLKRTYERMCTMRKVKLRKSETFIQFQDKILEQQRTYPQRLLEYTQEKKEFDSIHQTPKKKECKAKLIEANEELVDITHTFDRDQQCEKELDDQLNKLEKQGKLKVEAIEKELVEVEKRLFSRKTLLNGKIESQLVLEIEKLKHHPDMKIYDNDSSADSSVNEIAPTTHVFEKLSTDLKHFFKDPNDFPELRSNQTRDAKKHHRNIVDSNPRAKRARMEPVDQRKQDAGRNDDKGEQLIQDEVSGLQYSESRGSSCERQLFDERSSMLGDFDEANGSDPNLSFIVDPDSDANTSFHFSDSGLDQGNEGCLEADGSHFLFDEESSNKNWDILAMDGKDKNKSVADPDSDANISFHFSDSGLDQGNEGCLEADGSHFLFDEESSNKNWDIFAMDGKDKNKSVAESSTIF